jgi:hypothetical protein
VLREAHTFVEEKGGIVRKMLDEIIT